MKHLLGLLLILAVIGGGVWIALGGLDRVTEARIEQALVDKGAPPELAACMAARMVDRLSLAQLRKLERLKPREGESGVPLSRSELIDRIRRVDDPEAIEVTVMAGALCAAGVG